MADSVCSSFSRFLLGVDLLKILNLSFFQSNFFHDGKPFIHNAKYTLHKVKRTLQKYALS